MLPSQLHVVAAFSNHRRYNVRAKLFREWLERILDSGVKVTIVQHTIGERTPELNENNTPNLCHINLININGAPEHELWLQHALYNVGIRAMPEGTKYICWQDTDINHLRSDWPIEALEMLQLYRVGQTWTHSIDLGPQGEIVKNNNNDEVDRSFCAAWLAGDVQVKTANGEYIRPVTAKALLPQDKPVDSRSHTGYSWVMRMDALKQLGKLLDWLIIGSADWHMAHGFAGTLCSMCEAEMQQLSDAHKHHPNHYRKLLEFANRCDRFIKQDIGCVPGTIAHSWHGSKHLRFYGTRDSIIHEARFDPDTDITYDINGLPTLCTDNRLLRDGIRRYNTRRDEDSTYV